MRRDSNSGAASRTTPSKTTKYATYMQMVSAFGAGTTLYCMECGAEAERLMHIQTTSGEFLAGMALCEEHYHQSCQDMQAQHGLPVLELKTGQE